MILVSVSGIGVILGAGVYALIGPAAATPATRLGFVAGALMLVRPSGVP